MLVQFGSNWKVIENSSDSQIGLGIRPGPVLAVLRIFSSNYFNIGEHVVLLYVQILYAMDEYYL